MESNEKNAANLPSTFSCSVFSVKLAPTAGGADFLEGLPQETAGFGMLSPVERSSSSSKLKFCFSSSSGSDSSSSAAARLKLGGNICKVAEENKILHALLTRTICSVLLLLDLPVRGFFYRS